MDPENKKKKIGWGIYPFLDHVYEPAVGSALIDQMSTGKPYPIRAAWIQTTNTFVCGAADSERVYENFKKLDFVTVVDLFMTPTAMAFADIVLPAATYAERDGIALTGGHSLSVGAINKAIEPVGECKSDMEINLSLGKRLNPAEWPWRNVQEMFSAMIRPMGISFEEFREIGFAYDTFKYQKYAKGLLRPDKKQGFNTPTGKVELYSTVFEKCGLDPLPYFEEPPESPVNQSFKATSEYPLILTTGAKTPGFFHSEHRQIPLLRRLNPDPLTEIHPQTAEKYGIKDGDWIYIENLHGRCRQRAKLTGDIHPQVVHSQHGWWFPEKDGPLPSLFGAWESNVNVLLPSVYMGKSYIGKAGFGFPFKSMMCRIYRAEES
jgi:anaerobic selenocysteine-containing dehydrogenase